MAFDPEDAERRIKAPVHLIGQDLAALSVAELDERVQLLEAEIRRLTEARRAKEAQRQAASAFFKT